MSARVLFVEDDDDIRLSVGWQLEAADYVVVSAATGDEAMQMLALGGRFDLLFTDIRMPGVLDGWDLAEAARAMAPDIAVLYTSGFTDMQMRPVEGALFIAKPYVAADIVKLIDVLLSRRTPSEEPAPWPR